MLSHKTYENTYGTTKHRGKTAFIFAAGNQGWMGNNGRYDKNPEAELHYKVKVPFIVLTNI